MKIQIAGRLHPFSHQPGAQCVIPRSQWQIEAFPTLLRFHRFGEKTIPLSLPLQGPVRNFTLEQDLEKGIVRVYGEAIGGYFCYDFFREEGAIIGVLGKERLVICQEERRPPAESKERLSLGSHRSQDWEMVKRRGDLAEIFPAWLRLAQLTPEAPLPNRFSGMFHFIERCHGLIASQQKLEILPAFTEFFQGAFRSILLPRLVDEEYQGLTPPGDAEQISPLPLLIEGGKLIRSLFLAEKERELSLLPALPPAFHAGRLISAGLSQGDEIDLEWSKKLLKKVVYRSHSGKPFRFLLQKPLASFRMRISLKDPGKMMKREEEIFPKVGEILLFDRFQK